MAQEKNIPKKAADYRITLIGRSGRTFSCLCGMDDFSDDRINPTAVEHRSRGQLYAVSKGGDQPVRTGSFSYPLMTENNASADAFLDVITGLNNWEEESTGISGAGQPGDPYITDDIYVIDMQVDVIGAAVDGGDVSRVYSRVRFQPSESAGLDETKLAVNWMAYGGVTTTGPVAAS